MAQMLPTEVLYKIFQLLDFRQKVVCQEVCKAWNAALRSPCEKVWDRVLVGGRHFDLVDQSLSIVEARAQYVQAFTPISRQDRRKNSS